METHPPDMAVLARAIDGLTDQIAAMRAELSEIRRISSLTEITLKSYFRVSQSPNPEGHEGHVGEMNQSPQCQGKDRQKPPLVPEGDTGYVRQVRLRVVAARQAPASLPGLQDALVVCRQMEMAPQDGCPAGIRR